MNVDAGAKPAAGANAATAGRESSTAAALRIFADAPIYTCIDAMQRVVRMSQKWGSIFQPIFI